MYDIFHGLCSQMRGNVGGASQSVDDQKTAEDLPVEAADEQDDSELRQTHTEAEHDTADSAPSANNEARMPTMSAATESEGAGAAKEDEHEARDETDHLAASHEDDQDEKDEDDEDEDEDEESVDAFVSSHGFEYVDGERGLNGSPDDEDNSGMSCALCCL